MDIQEALQQFENELNDFSCYENQLDDKAELQSFFNNLKEAINYTHCSLQLPDDLEPVLAKIEHVNDLGKSSWYEVVYNDGNWRSYKGSNTFEDGEKVVKWKYCKAIV